MKNHYTQNFEKEKLTMSIDDMLKFIDDHGVIFDLIQIGYMQADCNEERLVDHDDAIRIFFEDEGLYPHVIDRLNDDSKRLLGTLIRIKTASRWADEFPNHIAAE